MRDSNAEESRDLSRDVLTEDWDRRIRRMCGLVRGLSPSDVRPGFDTLDIVQSALGSFLRSVEPRPGADVMPLLFLIARRKLYDRVRRQRKRDRVEELGGEIARLLKRDATAGEATEFADAIGRLRANLPRDEHRTAFDLFLAGRGPGEIATRVGVSLRTAQRWVELFFQKASELEP